MTSWKNVGLSRKTLLRGVWYHSVEYDAIKGAEGKMQRRRKTGTVYWQTLVINYLTFTMPENNVRTKTSNERIHNPNNRLILRRMLELDVNFQFHGSKY